MTTTLKAPTKKPSWLKVPLPSGRKYQWLKEKRSSLKLATVCEEALCPNIGECWSSGTATFMLMGDTCTRGCRFCAIKTSKKPPPLDPLEPINLAQTLEQMKLDYAVLTTVDRDDLIDQGSLHIKKCVEEISLHNPELLIEVLIPDFRGEEALVENVCQARPAVIAHNIETVERLTKRVRDRRAGYRQSLNVLQYVKTKHPEIFTKSSIMLGWGESEAEVLAAFSDLRAVDVDFLTIGQYLRPKLSLLQVDEYVRPEKFKFYEQKALEYGFKYVASGPLVRSSYKAGEYFLRSIIMKSAGKLTNS